MHGRNGVDLSREAHSVSLGGFVGMHMVRQPLEPVESNEEDPHESTQLDDVGGAAAEADDRREDDDDDAPGTSDAVYERSVYFEQISYTTWSMRSSSMLYPASRQTCVSSRFMPFMVCEYS